MRNKAFTLAELLMAVLVISIIMTALAPVITRRAYDNVSIEVNKKKGLEIYTNPGTYTFDVPVGINTLFLQGSGGGGGGAGATYVDKSVSFSADTTWTIPKGVNQLTFTITGAGGGGGAGNGRSKSDTCEARSNTIPAMADNGQDLCVSRVMPLESGGGLNVVKVGEQCSGIACCWTDVDLGRTECNKEIRNEGATCTQTVCTYGGMDYWCLIASVFPHMSWEGNIKNGRLITPFEYERIVSQAPRYLGADGLDLSWTPGIGLNSPPIELPIVSMIYGCLGSSNNYCYDNTVYASSASMGATGVGSSNFGEPYIAMNQDKFHYTMELASTVAQTRTGIMLCVRNLDNRELYSAAGGGSGAKYQRTINVLPDDTLIITIGEGGSGGSPNGANGAQGGTTEIVHKRGSVTMGTYYVKGGLGGNGATTTEHAKAIVNGTSNGQSTPAGTCYAQYRTNITAALNGGNIQCSTPSYSGSAGNPNSAGTGGKVANTGDAALGATLDLGQGGSKGVGYDATVEGFGGGGGYCGRGSGTTCSKGGKGARGKIDISYRIMLPGSGGGSGTRVGGSKTIAGADTQYEIKYPVSEGSRIVFEIGSGGSGGAVGQNGISGTATVIGKDNIVFLAGEGAKAVTQTQKNNLSNCIGTKINSAEISNCLNNPNFKSEAGRASVINQTGEVVTNTLGLIINAAEVDYTAANSSFIGTAGKLSNFYNVSTVPWNYGFDGGAGGVPFGVKSNNIPAATSCAGGISGEYGTKTDPGSYICTTGSPDANNAKTHDPVNNEFGGSGGSGGGVVENSLTLGQGSNGSSGYLRIRWDESEQE